MTDDDTPRREELIFKGLDGDIYIAPIDTELPTALTDKNTRLLDLPEGFQYAGHAVGDEEPAGVDLNTWEATLAFHVPSGTVIPTAFRLFGIFSDGEGDELIHVARLFAWATVASMEHVADDEWIVGARAEWSDEDGFAVKHFIGGPGWATRVASTGFTVAP